MTDKILIDTNLWVYLYAKQPSEKYLKIRQIIADNIPAIVVSTQILGKVLSLVGTQQCCVPTELWIVCFLELS